MSERSLFGELSYYNNKGYTLPNVDINKPLQKLEDLRASNEKIKGFIKPNNALLEDAKERNQIISSFQNRLDSISKSNNLFTASDEVNNLAKEYANYLQMGVGAKHEQSFKEDANFLETHKDTKTFDPNHVLSLRELRLAKYDMSNKKHPVTGERMSLNEVTPELNLVAPKVTIEDFNKRGEKAKEQGVKLINEREGYIDFNGEKIKVTRKTTSDGKGGYSWEGLPVQYVQQMAYSDLQSEDVQNHINQEATAKTLAYLKTKYGSQDAAKIALQEYYNKGNIFNIFKNDIENKYVDSYVRHNSGIKQTAESTVNVLPSKLQSGLKEEEDLNLNAPTTPLAGTNNPLNRDLLSNIDIESDGSLSKKENYRTDARGNPINSTISKTKNSKLNFIELYKNDETVKKIVDDAALVERLTNNQLPEKWQFGDEFIKGTIDNYKKAIKENQAVFLEERLNSVKKQKYKTKIAEATLTNRTFVPVSTTSKTLQDEGLDFNQLIDKYGEIEEVTSSGTSTANPYNKFPLSDNLQIKFKDKKEPIKFLTNLPNDKAQQAAQPLQNFMNIVFSGNSGSVNLPLLGEIKVIASYKDKKPKFLVLDKNNRKIKYGDSYLTTPKDIEEFQHKFVIFPILKRTELSYYGSENKTDPNSEEETD